MTGPDLPSTSPAQSPSIQTCPSLNFLDLSPLSDCLALGSAAPAGPASAPAATQADLLLLDLHPQLPDAPSLMPAPASSTQGTLSRIVNDGMETDLVNISLPNSKQCHILCRKDGTLVPLHASCEEGNSVARTAA